MRPNNKTVAAMGKAHDSPVSLPPVRWILGAAATTHSSSASGTGTAWTKTNINISTQHALSYVFLA
jgi:hypothetical protein